MRDVLQVRGHILNAPLEVMVRPRRGGKTTETIKWLMEPYGTLPSAFQGEALPGYRLRPLPHGARVLLCVDEHRAEWVRREYPLVRDLVYSVCSWDGGRGHPHGIEVALEDAESILYRAVGPCNLTRITISGTSV